MIGYPIILLNYENDENKWSATLSANYQENTLILFEPFLGRCPISGESQVDYTFGFTTICATSNAFVPNSLALVVLDGVQYFCFFTLLAKGHKAEPAENFEQLEAREISTVFRASFKTFMVWMKVWKSSVKIDSEGLYFSMVFEITVHGRQIHGFQSVIN